LLVRLLPHALLGYLIAVSQSGALTQFATIVGVGFCGAFTTFSTFSVETMRLLQDRSWGLASGNIGANVALSVFGVIGGLTLGHRLVG
jgi:CrcB protein